jgi:proteasome lid subunit RPN8/RPN11
MTWEYVAATNVMRQDDHRQSRLAAPSPRPQSKPLRSKLKRDQCHKSDSSLLHNHPSGDPKPSRDDIEMTREVKAAAEALGIAIHDHLVIGRKGSCQLQELGLLS